MASTILLFIGFALLLVGGFRYPGFGEMLAEHRAKPPITAFLRPELWTADGQQKLRLAVRIQVTGLTLIGISFLFG